MIVGITGPSGAGKSLFCSMLASHGFLILDCDKIYHEIISSPGECTDELVREFGGDILDTHGGIDRSALADKVFGSNDALNRLNSITHKYVMRKVSALAGSAERSGIHVAIDAPTLLEAGGDSICGMTVGILAPKPQRASRLAVRDGNFRTPQQLRSRIDASKPDEFYSEHCDRIFRNDKGYDKLEAFALQIAAEADAHEKRKEDKP